MVMCYCIIKSAMMCYGQITAIMLFVTTNCLFSSSNQILEIPKTGVDEGGVGSAIPAWAK